MVCISFQARVHDESLRFVLSEPAILALAENVPSTAIEIFDTIARADLNAESLGASFLSPSPVVCCHMDHLGHLFQEKIEDLDDLFRVILQKCIGQNASCPLTVFNYPLLVNSTMKPAKRIIPWQNGSKSTKQATRKASRQLFVQKFSCKSPVYHNCRIYANDGRLLCYCDRRKLEWLVLCHSTFFFPKNWLPCTTTNCNFLVAGIFAEILQKLLMMTLLQLCFCLNPRAVQKMKIMTSTFRVKKMFVLDVEKGTITCVTGLYPHVTECISLSI